MKLFVGLYILLAFAVWSTADDIRSSGHGARGAIKAATLALVWTVATVFIASSSWLGKGGTILHVCASAVFVAGGIAFDRYRHGRRVLSKLNEYGGSTYEEEFRQTNGRRFRSTYHLDAKGSWARVDRWEYWKGRYWIEDKTYYEKSGLCRIEWFDPQGRLVVVEDCEIEKNRHFNREFPAGQEAAAFLLDRWERSPFALPWAKAEKKAR